MLVFSMHCKFMVLLCLGGATNEVGNQNCNFLIVARDRARAQWFHWLHLRHVYVKFKKSIRIKQRI